MEGNDGEDIDDKADNAGDCNGARQIPHGVLDLNYLYYKHIHIIK